MEHRETDGNGSFEASGVGFNYRYDAYAKLLRVLKDGRLPKEVIVQVDLRGALSDTPVTYLHYLEKITQIKALAFSNYATVNLKEVLDADKWQGILGSSTRLASYAVELNAGRYEEFTNSFKGLYEFSQFQLEKIEIKAPGRDYYRAQISTRLHNEILIRASSLHGALYHLAEKIVSDLIALEFSTRREAEAYKLLQASSALGMIGRILDQDFVPERKIGNIHNNRDVGAV